MSRLETASGELCSSLCNHQPLVSARVAARKRGQTAVVKEVQKSFSETQEILLITSLHLKTDGLLI